MSDESKTREELLVELELLRVRLQEAEDVLRAIRKGEVDAIVLTHEVGEQIALITAPADPDSRTGQGTKKMYVQDVENLLRDRRQRSLRQLLGGESPAMKDVHIQVVAAASTESTVLLEGETGTGKTVYARWIYEHSPRASAPFVEINCAALRGDLLANELFGHVRGAFTSATDTKEGLLDVANNGTLFLDEIADMDLGVQAQFLKVLEEKKFRRLGATNERRSEFRLICATGRNLEDEIKQGRFRKDLYFRINVFPIVIPPLRERMEDLPFLAESLLQSIGLNTAQINPAAMRLLHSYDWPGNIRELRNILERAAILSGNTELKPQHFPGLAGTTAKPNPAEGEKERIVATLQRFGGNRQQTARALGMSRITLYRKLKFHGIT